MTEDSETFQKIKKRKIFTKKTSLSSLITTKTKRMTTLAQNQANMINVQLSFAETTFLIPNNDIKKGTKVLPTKAMILNQNDTVSTKMPVNELNYTFPQIAQLKRNHFG